MENRSHALMAGLFTILLGIAAVTSIWWFGGKHEATRDYLIVTRQNVTGLNQQAQVRYRGISVGKVQSIALDAQDSRNILVRVSVNEQVPVTRGTTAKLGYQGVTGIAHVLLEESGSDPAPLTGDHDHPPRIAMQASLIQELSEVGSETLRQARDLLTSANALLGAENRKRLGSTLASVDEIARDAAQISEQVRVLLSPENVRRLDSALARIDAGAGEVAPLIVDARATMQSLRGASAKLDLALGDPASGGIGALAPRVNELVGELSATTRQLNRVLRELETSPQSLVFGAPAAVPGPGEAGFVAPAARSSAEGAQP
jgi:phospholipid/cholesterol/gamma-HCH transport system substrate-binding protein